MKLILATLLHTLKTLYSTLLAVAAIIGAIIAIWGFLDVVGITEGQAKSMVEIPGELTRTIDLANQALEKYLRSR